MWLFLYLSLSMGCFFSRPVIVAAPAQPITVIGVCACVCVCVMPEECIRNGASDWRDGLISKLE